MHPIRTIPWACLLAAAAATSAEARQATEPPVSELIPALVQGSARIFSAVGVGHSEHFIPGAANLPALSALNRAIALEAAAFPLGPAATFAFAPDAGGPRRAVGTMGYFDNAWTIGRGRRAIGFGYHATTFNTYDDLDIRGSDVNVFIEHVCCSGDESERDLMQQTVSLRLHRKSAALSFSYGMTDRLDVGVVLPFVEVAGDARVLSRILRTATAADPSIHQYDVGGRGIDLGSRTFPSGTRPPAEGVLGTGASTARGVGDIVVRAKYALQRGATSASAVTLDLRLPSGNADDLVGLGIAQIKPGLSWSSALARVAVRSRIEFTLSAGKLGAPFTAAGDDLDPPREVAYAVGVDAPIAPRTRLTADVMGRLVYDVQSFTRTNSVFPSRGPGPLPSASFVAFDDLVAGSRRQINSVLVAVGGRLQLSAAAFVNSSVVFPVGQSGLQPAPTVVMSLHRGF
jgi:hypothetical protein